MLKNLVGRARPASCWQLLPNDGFFFPLQHTTATTALLMIAAHLLTRHASILVASMV